MDFDSNENEQANIDISPLIDMVFILLIFFMVSTTFVKDMAVNVNRPGAASATQANDKSIRVYVDQLDNVFINGEQVNTWIIQSRIREALKESGETSILVVTDKTVSAEKLIEVVDQCRLGGAKDIGVATDKEAS